MPLLLIFLSLIAIATPLRTVVRPTVESCVPAGRNQVLATVQASCPCFVRFRATNTVPSNTVVSFLVARKRDFLVWKKRNYRGTPRLVRRFSFGDVQLNRFVHALDKFGFNTAPLHLNVSGTYVLHIRTTSQSPDCSLSVQYVFHPLPETCPLRLPKPPPLTFSVVSRRAQLALPPPDAERYYPLSARSPIQPITRIVKGSPVDDPNMATFNVLLLSSDSKCTGSLIASRWVLTAAHCGVAHGLALVGGMSTQDGAHVTVQHVIPHPQFTRSRDLSRLENDVALVYLSRPAQGVPVAINSNPDAPDPDTIVRVSGYGQLFERWPSDVLHAVDLPMLGLDACRERFRDAQFSAVARGIDDDAHLCVGRDGQCKGGICEGDSGGPLVARATHGAARLVQVGIASYADTVCGNPDTPDVFTRVATYAEWIRNVTNDAPTFIALHGSNRGVTRVSPLVNGKGLQLSSVAKSVLVGLGAGIVMLCVALLLAIPVRAAARRAATSRTRSNPPDPDDVYPNPPPRTWRYSSIDIPRSLAGLATVVPERARGARASLERSIASFAPSNNRTCSQDR